MTDTKKLKTLDIEKDIEDIKTAAEILKKGGIVAIPTETVYGLAADAFNPKAVKHIYEAKGRPSDNPLIVHISKFDEIYTLAETVPENAKKLADAFWPGPLTIILPKKSTVPDETSGKLPTVAIRMPSNKIANKIIALSCPLAAPSANISGFPSPTSFEYVEADMMGRADAICDGGDCDVGVESTVITLATPKPKLLRPGGITHEMLESVIGEVEIDKAVLNPLEKGVTAASPGMKYKHYSPKAEITVVKGNFDEFKDFMSEQDENIAVLCFEGEEEYFKGRITVTMGKKDEGLTQTHRLFDALRELDEKGASTVYSRSPSTKGVGLAVCNRLYRAAAFRFINAIKRPVIGLTGPTGSGKGYVGEELKNNGYFVIDTDEIAHNITVKGSPVLKKITETFGDEILDENGNLIRRVLAEKAFSSSENTEKLNGITHPAIIKNAIEKCEDALNEGCKGAVIDAPLLFECDGDKFCNFVISVIAPDEIRLKRIMQRDNITEEQAKMRMNAQKNNDFYIEKADFVIKSYESFNVKEQLDGILMEFQGA